MGLGLAVLWSLSWAAAVPLATDTSAWHRAESQNHRMFGVGRDLCGSPSPTPLPKQGHPEQAAQDLVQAGLEYLQRRRLHNKAGTFRCLLLALSLADG